MTDLGDLNLDDVRTAVSRYRNLFYHRTVVLEGIRKIAFRNMVHLVEAIEYCESCQILDDANPVSLFQKKMLEDQGLKNDSFNRMLIGWATFYPLQVYLALLYAEIEHYRRFCEKSEILSDDALSGFLDNRMQFISKLHGFRDFFLHPSKDNAPLESAFLGHGDGSYNLAPELQKNLDEFMVRTRLKLADILKGILVSLPEVQRFYCTWGFIQLNYKRMEDHQDPQGMEHLVTQLEKLSKQMGSNSEDVDSWSPNPRQRKTAETLMECMNQVNPSGPEQQHANLATKQAPMTIHTLTGLLFGEQRPQSYGNSRAAIHLAESKTWYQRLIITAGVLLNEAITVRGMYSMEQLGELAHSMPLDEFHDVRMKAISGQGLQHGNEMASLSRVGVALLYEPLRRYAGIAKDNRLVASRALDKFSTPDKLKHLRIFRNSVFHVPAGSKHPLQVDLAITNPILIEEAFDLFGDLSEFFRAGE